jgi:hypothetical protein
MAQGVGEFAGMTLEAQARRAYQKGVEDGRRAMLLQAGNEIRDPGKSRTPELIAKAQAVREEYERHPMAQAKNPAPLGYVDSAQALNNAACAQQLQQLASVVLGADVKVTPTPAKVDNRAKIFRDALPTPSAIQAQWRDEILAVTTRQHDALEGLAHAMEYLLGDLQSMVKTYPQLEAIGRNWAARRGSAALGEAMRVLAGVPK